VLAGHYSAAFLAKAAEPRAPLWALVLAVQLVDVLWALFVLLGIEHLRLDPTLPSNPLDLYDMPYTHSLAGTLVWALLAAAVARAVWGSTRVAAAIGAAVASHWLLDWLVHRPDLALWPGSAKVGLGLWNHPLPALVLELGLLFGSAAVLAARVPWRRGVWTFAAVLAVFQVAVTFSPPQLGPAGVAVTALVLFLAASAAAARVERPVG
jgi:membrane-bound metal-dependent hydrolase YbcI (DUF457 family)